MSLETDGIRRYGVLIDSNAVRQDQKLLLAKLGEVLQRIQERPDERFILIHGGSAA